MHTNARGAAPGLGGKGASARRAAPKAALPSCTPPAPPTPLRPRPRAQVKLCLVINKIDRLILELRLSPQEAYERMKAIIAHVNMILSSFHSERYISGVCV